MINRAFYFLDGRLFEWVMSFSITMLSLMLFAWPEIIKSPAFRLFAWALPSELIGISFLICGAACIIALLVNGFSMKIGPRVRSWTALARAILWLQFGISTVQAGIEQGYPYTVTPFWLAFALAELWVAYRAILDVRSTS